MKTPKSELKFDRSVTLSCACGGKYTAGYVNNEPTLMHTLPTCRDFCDLAPDVYMAKQRELKSKN